MSNMLEVADLGHTYGDYEAIGGLTFTVRAGELVCVVGPSGCGKSTLLRTISGLIAPSRGDVSLKGKSDQVPVYAAAGVGARQTVRR